MAEQFALLYQAALAAPYTAGSGSIEVTAPVRGTAPTQGTFDVSILDNTTGNVIVVFRVTSVSGTTFTGDAEGPDASAPSASAVYGTMLTPDALNQIEADTEEATIAALNAGGVLEASALPDSGVTAGSYTNTNLTVDDKGRITSASDGSGGSGSFSVPPPYLSDGTFDYLFPGFKVTGQVSGFSWENQGGSTDTIMPSGAVFLVGQQTGGNNISFWQTAAPSSPYTRTFAISSLLLGEDFETIAIGLRSSVSGLIELFGIQVNPGPSYFLIVSQFSSFTQNTGTPSQVPSMLGFSGQVLFFQVENDGTNITWSISIDGANFLPFFSATIASYFGADVPDQIGVMLNNPNSGPTTNFNACTVFAYQ